MLKARRMSLQTDCNHYFNRHDDVEPRDDAVPSEIAASPPDLVAAATHSQ